MGNYNDALLEQLADQGDGFYAYVNDLAGGPPAVHRRPRLDAPDRRARRQGAGRVRSRRGHDVPAHRLREPGHRRPRLPRSARRRRRHRGRPRGHRPLRPLAPRGGRPRRGPRDGPAALDGARGRPRVRAPERDPGRRPGAAVRGDRSDLPARRDRGRRGRGAARRTAARTCRTCGRSSTSPTRTAASRPPTRSTTSCGSSSGWTSSAAEPPAIGCRAVRPGRSPSPVRRRQTGSPSVGSVGGGPIRGAS